MIWESQMCVYKQARSSTSILASWLRNVKPCRRDSPYAWRSHMSESCRIHVKNVAFLKDFTRCEMTKKNTFKSIATLHDVILACSTRESYWSQISDECLVPVAEYVLTNFYYIKLAVFLTKQAALCRCSWESPSIHMQTWWANGCITRVIKQMWHDTSMT